MIHDEPSLSGLPSCRLDVAAAEVVREGAGSARGSTRVTAGAGEGQDAHRARGDAARASGEAGGSRGSGGGRGWADWSGADENSGGGS